MIGMVIALNTEANGILKLLTNKTQSTLGDKKIFKGKLFDKEVVIIVSGIGKVNASLSTQYLIDKYPITHIVNIGTCGGVESSLKIGEFYQVNDCCQPDFDVTEIDDVEIGYIQDYDRVYFKTHNIDIDGLEKKRLATTDKFSNKEEFINQLIKMKVDFRDMEGCAIAQVCTSNNVPLIMAKGITDIYANGNGKEFYENLNTVCSKIPSIVKSIISKL